MSLVGRALKEARTVIASSPTWSAQSSSWGSVSTTGINITHETAMGTSAFFACVRLISDHISTLPIQVYQRYSGARYTRPAPFWLDHPNPEMTWPEFMAQTVVSELLDGNWFWGVNWADDGTVGELWPLDPRYVTVFRDTDTLEIKYRFQSKIMTARDIIHGRAVTQPGALRGINVVEAAKQALGIAAAAEQASGALYRNGLLSQVVITSDKPVKDDDAKAMANRFAAAHSGVGNAWKPVVFGNGAKVEPLTITPEQAQFLQSRSFQVEEVARWMGVPLSRIQSQEKSTSWGSGIEQFNIQYTQDAILPRTVKYEARILPLIQRHNPDFYVKFNINGLLRGDMAARSNFYRTMNEVGAYSPNDVLAKEDENPFAGGDAHYMQLSYAAIQPDGSLTPAVPPTTPAPVPGG